MLLSILIRNYNEAQNLEKTLLLLQKQQLPEPYEIVVSDNESTDNSIAIAEAFGCRIVTNQRSKFSYGQLLNFGISHCQGQYIFLLSAHVAVIGGQSVANGVQVLMADEQVAYVCGMPANQVNMMIHGLQPIVYTQSNFSSEKHWQEAEFYLLGAPCGIIRKSVWKKIPFDETLEFSEDRYWSRCVIESGYKGVFGADLFFYYFKQKDSKANRQRQYAASLAHYKIYGRAETGHNFYLRNIKTAAADVYVTLAGFPKLLLLLLKIRFIRRKSHQPPTVRPLEKAKK